MPWLIHNRSLFVHVPRSGGTSLAKLHRTKQRACKDRDVYHKMGIWYFYYRYMMLERANFPVVTFENLVACVQVVVATLLFTLAGQNVLPYFMWCSALMTFTISTLIATASLSGRLRIFRIPNMFLFGKLMLGFGSDAKYITGVNWDGWLVHFTAAKMVRYGYASRSDITDRSFSIVRNPYSRLVSIYHFNKRPFESFESFLGKFLPQVHSEFLEQSNDECTRIYCHALPISAYTHEWSDGRPVRQFVGFVMKQENLGEILKSSDMQSEFGVPDYVREAIEGMPHRNRRKRKATWPAVYNQRTMEMVFKAYHHDFEVFGYSPEIPGRPDLVLPAELRERLSVVRSVSCSGLGPVGVTALSSSSSSSSSLSSCTARTLSLSSCASDLPKEHVSKHSVLPARATPADEKDNQENIGNSGGNYRAIKANESYTDTVRSGGFKWPVLGGNNYDGRNSERALDCDRVVLSLPRGTQSQISSPIAFDGNVSNENKLDMA